MVALFEKTVSLTRGSVLKILLFFHSAGHHHASEKDGVLKRGQHFFRWRVPDPGWRVLATTVLVGGQGAIYRAG